MGKSDFKFNSIEYFCNGLEVFVRKVYNREPVEDWVDDYFDFICGNFAVEQLLEFVEGNPDVEYCEDNDEFVSKEDIVYKYKGYDIEGCDEVVYYIGRASNGNAVYELRKNGGLHIYTKIISWQMIEKSACK